jgi:hypothetical protein
MYDMFWKASAFKQTIPEEWKNKGDLWGLTPEKQRTADKGGYFFLFSSRVLGNQQGQIQVVQLKGQLGVFFPCFLVKRAI